MNSNKKFIPLAVVLFISTVFLLACKKETKCDNARICVKNVGNDIRTLA